MMRGTAEQTSVLSGYKPELVRRSEGSMETAVRARQRDEEGVGGAPDSKPSSSG